VTEGVPQLVNSTDCYLLLLFQVGTNDTASQNAGRVKEHFKALEVKAKRFSAEVIFSSILPVEGRGSARNRRTVGINSWLRVWCRHKGFGLYDKGTFFNDHELLERDGIHPSGRGKGILGSRLVNLMGMALN